MSTQSIRFFGDPVLATPSLEVVTFDKELRNLVKDLTDTMLDAGGAGLAAPQIGWDVQLVIFGTGEVIPRYPDAAPIPPTVLINPKITVIGDDIQNDWEGCLSVPGLRAVVPRAMKIRYTGFDEMGRPIDRVADGFHAKVVQHECDHLNGEVYLDRLSRENRKEAMRKLRQTSWF